jgi:hypothetical protein
MWTCRRGFSFGKKLMEKVSSFLSFVTRFWPTCVAGRVASRRSMCRGEVLAVLMLVQEHVWVMKLPPL